MSISKEENEGTKRDEQSFIFDEDELIGPWRAFSQGTHQLTLQYNLKKIVSNHDPKEHACFSLFAREMMLALAAPRL
jgi:hypothetical protein